MAGRRPSASAPGRAAVVLAVLVLAAPGGRAVGQEWIEMETMRQAHDVSSLEVSVEYGAGRLVVRPAEPGLLYRAVLRYDGTRFRPVRSYTRTDEGARLRLGLTGRKERGSGLGLASLDELEDLELTEAGGGELRLGLGREVPVALELRTGATESRLELGGVPLRRLTLETGASDTRVTFDRPNPEPMERLEIRAGAASVRVLGLGHARPREIEVAGAVGDVTLDFGGEWRGDATARIRVGVGSLELRVPRELGVQVEKDGLLASFSAPDLRRVDDVYRSANWDAAPHRLVLRVEAAFGSVSIETLP